jgi:gliding motility-associated-like protein
MGIFDRWGSSLFVSEDITQGWDGTAKGKLLNPGIYIYFIEVEIVKANGEKEKRLLKGDVLLAR